MRGLLYLFCDRPVKRPFSAAPDHERNGDNDHEEMKFIPLALLIAEPVHEEPVLQMHQEHGHHHVDCNAERRDPGQKTRDQTEATQPSSPRGGTSAS